MLTLSRGLLGRMAMGIVIAVGIMITAAATVCSAEVSDDTDHSRLVVKLAPIGTTAQKLTLGATGRPAFDALLNDWGITELRQAVPPLSPKHKNAANALRKRLTEYVVINVPEGLDAEHLRKDIELLPGVEFVEYDAIVRITAVTPNDPYFLTRQYTLRNTGTQPPADPGTAGADMEMEEAWEHTTGDTSVVLAIIDTGIDLTHPDLMFRIWENTDETQDGSDLDGNGYISDWRGWNFWGNNNNPDDDHSHGSHCAGIAGADANNNEGIAGMDWKCRLMALKALGSSGSGSAADVAEANTYAADNGADIISMSLGSFSPSSLEEDAIDYAVSLGVTVFAAMGNDDVITPHYPAAFPNAIAVGATDSDDNRAHPFCGAPGSNFGDYIDICAGGDWVWSCVLNGNYGYKCGTSMATPHAAGLGALIKALRPAYTPAQIRSLMRASAEDQVGRLTEDTPGFDIYHGWGRINGRIALQALTMEFAPILSVPVAQTVTELETLEFLVTATDSNFTTPSISAEALTNATFVDSGNGVGLFSFSPDIEQSGVYNIMFVASDGDSADTEFVSITVEDGCLCPFRCDYDESGFLDALDLNKLIDVLFFGVDDILDVGCLNPRADFDCSGFADAVDLNGLIEHLFFSGPPPCDPCQP